MTAGPPAQDDRPLQAAAWLGAPPLKKVFAAFAKAGHDIRAVGGAVRNSLIGLPICDVDLATPARPQQVIDIAEAAGLSAHATGIDHGTITIVADGQPFEVTTLRRDVETDGRHAVVAFTTDWREDAQRRDFTINAIYAAADGSLFDPTGGRDDLEAQRVRFIGNAQTRIREDYLRILRFFRFSACYGAGEVDAEGLAAVTMLKSGIGTLSPERIGAEMLKLVAAPRAADVIGVMHTTGILAEIFDRPTRPDIFARLAAIENALGRAADWPARLAALTFDGSDDISIAKAVAERLRLSQAQASALAAIAGVRDGTDPSIPEPQARAALYCAGPEAFSRAALLNWARSPAAVTDRARRHRLDLPQRWRVPGLPVRGRDVMALGIAPGPQVGKILAAFEEWWISADFPSDPAMQQMKLRALAADG